MTEYKFMEMQSDLEEIINHGEYNIRDYPLCRQALRGPGGILRYRESAQYTGLFRVMKRFRSFKMCSKNTSRRSVTLIYLLKSVCCPKNSIILSVKFFSEPRKSGRSVKSASERLAGQGFQLPRVRKTASIRED